MVILQVYIQCINIHIEYDAVEIRQECVSYDKFMMRYRYRSNEFFHTHHLRIVGKGAETMLAQTIQ